MFVIALDQTILSTALPRIASDFDAFSLQGWVSSAYVLTQTTFILIFAQSIRVLPAKHVLLGTVVVFEIGSIVCATAHNVYVLIVGRAVSGVGGGGITVAAMQIITQATRIEQRPVLFSLVGAVFAISAVAGPLAGVNLPIGGITLVTALVFLKTAPALGSLPENQSGWPLIRQVLRMDWVGGILALGWITALTLALQWGGNVKPWGSTPVIVCFVVAAVVFVIFMVYEWWIKERAMIPSRVFKSKSIWANLFFSFFVRFSMFIMTYYIPIFYQAARHASAQSSGINLLPFMLGSTITILVCGAIVGKTGRYWLFLIFGPVVSAVGTGLLYTINQDTRSAALIGFQIIAGIGNGAGGQNSLIAMQAEFASEPGLIGTATSMATFAQFLGATIGLGVAEAVFSSELSKNLLKFAPSITAAETAVVKLSPTDIYTSLPASLVDPVRHAYAVTIDTVLLLGVPLVFLFFSSLVTVKPELREHIPAKVVDSWGAVSDWTTGKLAGQAAPAMEDAEIETDPEVQAEFLPSEPSVFEEVVDPVSEVVVEVPEEGPIFVTPIPSYMLQEGSDTKPITSGAGVPGEKYLTFLPHSGYHNQRVAVQNALMMGNLLNRTVILPPVWLGFPVGKTLYDKLQLFWTNAFVAHPASFGMTKISKSDPYNKPADYEAIVPPTITSRFARERRDPKPFLAARGIDLSTCKSNAKECRAAYNSTWVSWEWMTGISSLKAGSGSQISKTHPVKIIERWDIREQALMDLINVTKDDVVVFKDEYRYDYAMDTSLDESAPLVSDVRPEGQEKFRRTVNVKALAKLDQKVLVFGSLFGGGRMRGRATSAFKKAYGLALAFRTPHILTPAKAIVDRLGGKRNYLALHARVAEGTFLQYKFKSMQTSWMTLVGGLIGEEDKLALWEDVKPAKEEMSKVMEKRGLEEQEAKWEFWEEEYDEDLGDEEHDDDDEPAASSPSLVKRASIPLSSLTCRGTLHTKVSLLPLNQPLYIATDSRYPEDDPALTAFFKTFPCAFLLSDFEKPSKINNGVVSPEIGEMKRLTNRLDDVPLGRPFTPFIEAVVASMAGTVALHDAYMADTD
ncbi:Major facilitator transporter-like protein [Pseudohyphozyma bogoriensis]|nr:Major facilitator transporter-like protein [Pseudohyphozyma bogoriensis]